MQDTNNTVECYYCKKKAGYPYILNGVCKLCREKTGFLSTWYVIPWDPIRNTAVNGTFCTRIHYDLPADDYKQYFFKIQCQNQLYEMRFDAIKQKTYIGQPNTGKMYVYNEHYFDAIPKWIAANLEE